MAQKATAKKTPAAPDTAEASDEVRLGLRVYAKAAGLLAWGWAKRHKRWTMLSAVLLVVLIAGLVYVLWPDPAQISNDDIIVQIGRELSISGDGNPAILSVVDKEQATQPFLEQAENGDKVVLYYKAKKAVLYRPSEQRIVHQGAYVPPDAKIFIRKGTADSKRVAAIKEQLKGVQDIEVSSQDASRSQDYQGITLVNVTDRYDAKINELEKLFNTKVVRMPAGESFPDADILIIVGSE